MCNYKCNDSNIWSFEQIKTSYIIPCYRLWVYEFLAEFNEAGDLSHNNLFGYVSKICKSI